MYEWNEIVQRIVDLIDDNIENSLTLIEISEKIGYSPFYCSRQFHEKTEMTIKEYTAGRKLCFAAIDLRDTSQRILDIALKYNFSSQEAFSRAFKEKFHVTPAVYRQFPRPIPLPIRKEVFSPYHYIVKENLYMESNNLYQAQIKFETLPAHKFIGIRSINAEGYWDIWSCTNADCDYVTGINESMLPLAINNQANLGGWFYKNGKKGYLYGMLMPQNYSGEIPEGMECIDILESEYLVFYHPPFDYMRDNGKVMGIVESLAWNFDPAPLGYEWNEVCCQDYQRHYPEVLGYAILRPVKKISATAK
ncbi:helix-turn-helix transcriptional regulator [Clostridium sp. 19966]|uniref:AraC family transcriptional regulator n=1 Tax=Clostridium sp. 19966 TaxID=2768166 RepID=UPI0028DE08D9|nr:AraC family transcriptional regulator [Clostridium sp. 19966]MDT8717734.1 helix-turn-helix transcriptional regulator [Clostridium sp. 19966]